MDLAEVCTRLEELLSQAMAERMPIELRTAIGRALDVGRTLERQARCSHERASIDYGSDHHGTVELRVCPECGWREIVG